MKIAVMATGGVGGVFGAQLAKAGKDVHFIARGAHLDAIRKNGLTIAGDDGETVLPDVQATDDPAAIGPVDVVMFAVKLWDTETAAAACKPLLGPDTVVIPFQNGVVATEKIAGVLGAEHTGSGLSRVSASIESPGVIRRVGTFGGLEFAEADSTRSPRMEAFLAACEGAGIEAKIPGDIERAVWMKYVVLVTVSGMTTAGRLPMRTLIAEPEGRATALACMAEVAAVGRAKGINLPDDAVENLTGFIDHMPPAMKASMAIDLENGRRLEAPWLCGTVCEMGREVGVPTPVNDALYAVIRPYNMGPPAAP
ncbi:MAG: 2-dehydropantoate 2-reductase [Rhodospirillaceae bacterium]